MPMVFDIQALISAVDRLKPGAPLDKFITSAMFPNFKNIAPGTKIEFSYPLTALVGVNGTGKSSILHALWGMPLRQSTSRFWFSTAVDPIGEGGEFGPPRYFFSHHVKALQQTVQTRKMRVSSKKGYWEPARLSIKDGMDPLPSPVKKDEPYRSIDRWNPPSRKVIYINFKCEFSAFDRFFYFPPRGETLERRQNAFLAGAMKLRRVIDGKFQTYSPGGKQAVFENRDLSRDELDWVSYILGREYTAARIVQHRLYGGIESPSVIFVCAGKKYSEAFAGSGELAIVRAVIQLLVADTYSLILLDEPETSLHPGAQERLICFLLKIIQTKHTQIVISTHSPSIVHLLPTKAIKVLEELSDGKSIVINVSHPQVAFNRLGIKSQGKFTIAVEDALLSALVNLAMRALDAGEREAFDLYVPPGAASSILSTEIPLWLTAGRDVYVLLDGDQRPKKQLPDPDNLTDAQKNSLGTAIKDAFGVLPMHISDGHVEPALGYVKWVSERLRFLDSICPEYILLEALIGSEEAAKRATNNQEAKAAYVSELKSRGHGTDAQSLSVSVTYILETTNPAYSHIRDLEQTIKYFIKHNAAQVA